MMWPSLTVKSLKKPWPETLIFVPPRAPSPSIANVQSPKVLSKREARLCVTVLAIVDCTSFFTPSSSHVTSTPPCGFVASALTVPWTVRPSRRHEKSAEKPLKSSAHL